jgi:hypothetical protein
MRALGDHLFADTTEAWSVEDSSLVGLPLVRSLAVPRTRIGAIDVPFPPRQPAPGNYCS